MKFLAFVLKRLEPLTAQSGRLLARMALWLIGLIVLDRVVSFGMSPLWLFCGAAIGIIMAGSPSAQRLTSLGLWTSSALVALIYWIVQRS
ncbi:MAG: hypothetical protein KDD62_11675, partial [Bdellovibrionales bacterium]|nr:hypothetical protein [Bdellovibrionales bacterium]